MLEVKIDDAEVRALAKSMPDRSRSAMATALRGESLRLNTVFRSYAGSGQFGPFAPVTVALRKKYKGGYGPWIKAFSRYFVDPESLSAQIGVLSKDDVKAHVLADERHKVAALSRGFAASARRLAAGYRTTITLKQQRSLAKILMSRYQTDLYHSWVPRIGARSVKARPVASTVFAQERARSIRNIRKLYQIKMAGGRYSKNWAAEWGNE